MKRSLRSSTAVTNLSTIAAHQPAGANHKNSILLENRKANEVSAIIIFIISNPQLPWSSGSFVKDGNSKLLTRGRPEPKHQFYLSLATT